MANRRLEIPDNIKAEIRLLVEQGVSVRSIAGKFKCSIASVSRICAQKPIKTKSLSVPQKSGTMKQNAGDLISTDSDVVDKKTDLAAYQTSIAHLAFQKAKAIIKSINYEKVPDGQKAMTAGILIDKARLITGQAGSITEHRDIQFVALKMLDERQKKVPKDSPGPVTIDVRPIDAPQNDTRQNPIDFVDNLTDSHITKPEYTEKSR